MFNFFKKQEQIEEMSQPNNEDQIQASVSYYVVNGSNDVLIDVAIQDNDKSIDDLCKILDVLSQPKAYVETVNIIKDNLVENGDEEALMKVLIHVGKKTSQKIFTAIDEINNQPCIRPSDMLK